MCIRDRISASLPTASEETIVTTEQSKISPPVDAEGEFTEPLRKGFLRHEFGCSDKTLAKKLAELNITIHPDDALPNNKHNLRLKVDTLVNTQIYNPQDRSAKLLKWKSKS